MTSRGKAIVARRIVAVANGLNDNENYDENDDDDDGRRRRHYHVDRWGGDGSRATTTTTIPLPPPPPPMRRRGGRRYRATPIIDTGRLLVLAIARFAIIAVPAYYVIGRISTPSGVDDVDGDGGDPFVRGRTKGGRRTSRASMTGDVESGGRRRTTAIRHDGRSSRHGDASSSSYHRRYVPKYPPSAIGYDVYDCPSMPPPGYPKSWRASEVLGSWSPHDVDEVPSGGGTRDVHQGLCVFDHRTQLDRARAYRDAELPFVVRGDPSVMDVVGRWEDDREYLHDALGDDVKYRVERSTDANFMWYRLRGRGGAMGGRGGRVDGKRRGRGGDPPPPTMDYVLPPNDEVEMTFGEWLEHALRREGRALDDVDMIARADSLRERRMRLKDGRTGKWRGGGGGDIPLDDDATNAAARNENDDEDDGDREEAKEEKYYYFRVNANLREVEDGSSISNFLYNELAFFDPREPESEFYIVDPMQQRGINCRFGMRGVTAANHFDMSRNTIAVLGGRRRYVLASPTQCNRMALYPVGHPSVRHSSFDWGDPMERAKRPNFEDALLQEVVLHGGDVLYLPTNWFHFIVNLSLNYQCNARSGTTFETADVVGACGFKMRPGDFRVQ